MNWIKKRRQELGMSQEDLARKLQLEGIDISRGAIGHWEVNRYEPPLKSDEFRKALANALQLTAQELLIRAGFETLSDAQQSREAALAASIIERMSPDKREMALRILEAMDN